MTRVRRNLVAGYAGSVWAGLMSLVFIPIYVRMLGIEAYGIVGLFVTLQGLLSVLDLGLTTTVNREFARLSTHAEPEKEQRTLLRTVETIYWLVAVLIGGLVITAAPLIAAHWVRPEELSIESIAGGITMMGVAMLFHWPLSLYSGGLLGLQRHVLLNAIAASMATARALGALVVMWLLGATLKVFFGWQIVISIVHTASVAVALWSCVGAPQKARLDLQALLPLWRFAAGIVLIGVFSTALMQVDKLMVSKLLPLSDLGYYAVAAAVALSLYRIITPFFAATFPRFSQLAAADDETALVSLYHRSCEALSIIMLPAAVFLAFFSREVILLWTQDAEIAAETRWVLSMLVAGTALSGLTNLPYAVQLAYGWTRLALTYSVISILVLFPLAYIFTQAWGTVGASMSWMVYNAIGFLLLPSLMHRRVLRGEQARFYVFDVGVPLAAAVIASSALRVLMADAASFEYSTLLVALAGTAAIVQGAALMAARGTREWIVSAVRGVRAP